VKFVKNRLKPDWSGLCTMKNSKPDCRPNWLRPKLNSTTIYWRTDLLCPHMVAIHSSTKMTARPLPVSHHTTPLRPTSYHPPRKTLTSMPHLWTKPSPSAIDRSSKSPRLDRDSTWIPWESVPNSLLARQPDLWHRAPDFQPDRSNFLLFSVGYQREEVD
jgi:hypothetical protein